MKILLGGVPLGCDNIGDEAIIANVVALLRKTVPEAELTVCTRARKETAELLGVSTLPLYGFPSGPDIRSFGREIRNYDVYMWFGATGLSDYPEDALKLLDTAHRAGLTTIVWGVGMNSRLNPAFYEAAGKRRKLLRLMSLCSFRLIDWISLYERFLCSRTRKHIRRSLENTALTVLRDEESVLETKKCGFSRPVLGADTAILQKSAEKPPLPELPGAVRIGFCISAQNAVRQLDGIRSLWDSLLERPDFRIALIPMNPKTDRELMLKIAAGCRRSDRIDCLNSEFPADVQACAAQCRVVVSSRLHLLILASNAGVPGLGIERGSKITNWLKAFGRFPSGTVDNCDFASLEKQILKIAAQPAEQNRREIMRIMDGMRARLESASAELSLVLSSVRK